MRGMFLYDFKNLKIDASWVRRFGFGFCSFYQENQQNPTKLNGTNNMLSKSVKISCKAKEIKFYTSFLKGIGTWK
jgi:hypothetical protein